MMKTIKGSIAAGKTTTLVKMLNELEGKTLLVQNDTIPEFIFSDYGYKGDLLTIGWDVENLFFYTTEPYVNIGVDLHGLTKEKKETALNILKLYAGNEDTNFIVTEYAEGSKYLEVV